MVILPLQFVSLFTYLSYQCVQISKPGSSHWVVLEYWCFNSLTKPDILLEEMRVLLPVHMSLAPKCLREGQSSFELQNGKDFRLEDTGVMQ